MPLRKLIANRLRSLAESDRGEPNLVDGLVSSVSLLSGTTLLEYRGARLKDCTLRWATDGNVDKGVVVNAFAMGCDCCRPTIHRQVKKRCNIMMRVYLGIASSKQRVSSF